MVPRFSLPSRRTSSALVAGLAVVGLTVLYFNEPTTAGFYPQCVFHSLTGLDCPGCGATRALYALLHGHVGTAFRFNPLLFVLAPLLIAALVAMARGRTLTIVTRPWFAWTMFVVLTGYWIVRNTPMWPY